MTKYPVISSDSHVVEPVDLWTSRIDPGYRDQAPHSVRQEDGTDRWFAEDNVDMGSMGTLVGAGLRYTDPSKITFLASMDDVPRGGYDPDEHVRDMDVDGVKSEVIYPSIGLRMFRIFDSRLLSAVFHAYNDWLAEFCNTYPDRLKGIATINVDDVQEAVGELKRTRKLGLVGAMISVLPPEKRSYRHPDYEPLWATAQDLDIPLSLHIGTQRPTMEEGRFTGFLQAGVRSAEVELANMDPPVRMSLAAMIFSGVFDRYPNLKVISVEHGIGWLPFVLRMMDFLYRERQEQAFYRFKGDTLPSDFMRHNVSFSFQDDDLGIRLRDMIGVDSLMWGNDYPHAESTFPRSLEILDEILVGVPDEERAKISGGNCARLYHFN